MIAHIDSYIWLALGFGFVIFFHELGHFLAAKWAGVKVEQFAVGFGQAILSWRKGLGLRVGSSHKEYEEKLRQRLQASISPESSTEAVLNSRPWTSKEEAHDFTELELAHASGELGISETEYRLNWIPLGGYVKMLGQDDLNPNAVSADPRSFNSVSIAKRMAIVSAGVIMNIILAALGFMVLFLIGFHVAPAIVGGVMPNSPAQLATKLDGTPAPLQVGDQILFLNGKPQYDFTKISLDTALLQPGVAAEMDVRRRDGANEKLLIKPARLGGKSSSFLMLGIDQPRELRALDQRDYTNQLGNQKDIQHLLGPNALALKPGDVITEVNGQPVKVDQYWKLDQAMQECDGKPVQLTVRNAAGQTRTVAVTPMFAIPFGGKVLNFAGMQPRSSILEVMENSPARDKILPGDVILRVDAAGHIVTNPTNQEIKKCLEDAGARGQAVKIRVLRGGRTIDLPPIVPSIKIAAGEYGLGVGLDYDGLHSVVADIVANSPAAEAGIEPGTMITSINGQPVSNWFQVVRILSSVKPNSPIHLGGTTITGKQKTWQIQLTGDEIAEIGGNRVRSDLTLHERIEVRKTSNPLIAAEWGVTETRDFLQQFYLTLQRMVQQSVSYTNMMGPVGIIHAGAELAYRGTDWLLWFLAMISANLAVVNFLPIPVVDGGLFMFLIIEKIKGKPLSPRTQSIATMVGMALLLGVFLLVTIQDINRIYPIF